MRFLFFMLVCLWGLPLTSQKITTAQWQEDLTFLQKTVHEEYPFLFKKVTASDFDTAVTNFYKAIPNMVEHEIVVGFAKIIALFQYGHTRMRLSDSPVTFHKLPLQLYQFTDGIYITGAQKEFNDVIGVELLEIEGQPIAKVLKAVYPVVPVENEHFFKAYGINMALLPEVLHAQGVVESVKSELEITVEKDGRRYSRSIAATSNMDFPLQYGEVQPDSEWGSARDLSNSPRYLKNLDKHYYYEFLPDANALYIRYSQVLDDPSETVAAFYARVFEFLENNTVERMILDVRLNGGGNNYNNKQVITGIIENREINKTGKLYVIIGRRTFSACQNLVNELTNYTNAIFIGEPTAENINFYGDNKKVVLPNSKMPVYLSFAWWQDLPQWENGPYTQPNILVASSFSDYQANKDPVLEKALTFDGERYIKNPMEYLRGLFMEKKFELLESEAKRLARDPLYAAFPFEAEFTGAGYRLLDAGQTQEAIYVFQLNANLFPESAYGWYALGEAYEKAGNREEAIKTYTKVIALDTKDIYKQYAQEKLETITKK